ncbi:MAG: RluA family pseudouridine synthase [Elusimicrobia bacterium]|nr:RluA family pseudouridine synthase [Elusimicrobiota bacterium]
MLEYIVDIQSAGERLDKYLAGASGFSRSRVKVAIEEERVLVGGGLKPAHYAVREGEKVEFFPKKINPADEKVEMPLEIIYEDEAIAVINKSAGLVVHPAPGCFEPTLLNGLLFHYPSCEIVHRLDMDTSGVIVVSLNQESAISIKKQFKDRKVRKNYLALAQGTPEPKKGVIDFPIRRSRRNPTMMSVGWVAARQSKTLYEVMEQKDGVSLISVSPITGRTHQIRVHFSHLGHPLLGDLKYGGSREDAPRQMLHAYSIEFLHPSTGKEVFFKADIPEDFDSQLVRRGFGLKSLE